MAHSESKLLIIALILTFALAVKPIPQRDTSVVKRDTRRGFLSLIQAKLAG